MGTHDDEGSQFVGVERRLPPAAMGRVGVVQSDGDGPEGELVDLGEVGKDEIGALGVGIGHGEGVQPGERREIWVAEHAPRGRKSHLLSSLQPSCVQQPRPVFSTDKAHASAPAIAHRSWIINPPQCE